MKLFFAWLPVLLLLAAMAGGEEILLPCDSCGPYKWLVAEQLGNDRILSWDSFSNQALSGKPVRIDAKLISYDQSLSDSEVIMAVKTPKALLGQKDFYVPDGFLPKKYHERRCAVFCEDRIKIEVERKEVWPTELFLFFLSAILLGFIYATMKSHCSEAGGWLFFPPAIALAATVTLATIPTLRFFLPEGNIGGVFGFIVLCVMDWLIVALVSIVAIMLSLFSTYLCEKITGNNQSWAADNYFLTSIWLLLLIAAASVLPITYSAKLLPSAFFAIFLPGLISGLSFSWFYGFLERQAAQKEEHNKNRQELGPHD